MLHQLIVILGGLLAIQSDELIYEFAGIFLISRVQIGLAERHKVMATAQLPWHLNIYFLIGRALHDVGVEFVGQRYPLLKSRCQSMLLPKWIFPEPSKSNTCSQISSASLMVSGIVSG